MQAAALPVNESQRLAVLRNYQILDSLTEKAYDDLAELAAEICAAPIALISLIDADRQWFKSHHGLDVRETPRDVAFCAHAILQQDFFEVCDSREDERFSDNPLVTGKPHVIFYGGAVLATPCGHNLGTLCVIDHKARQLSQWQKRCLTVIARQVVSLLELRKALSDKHNLSASNKRSKHWIKRRQQELARFAYRSSHDLRAPAIQIHNLTKLLREDLLAGKDDEVAMNSVRLAEISEQLLAFIDGVVEVGRAELLGGVSQSIDFNQLVQESVRQANTLLPVHKVSIRTSITATRTLRSEYLRLRQLLVHLITNSIQYADLERAEPYVMIQICDSEDGVSLSVMDNGIGIAEEDQASFFEMFSRFHPRVCAGSGVGTTIVSKHANAIGARVFLNSGDSGTTVTVSLPQAARETANA